MELRKIPPHNAINSLISVFYDSDPELRQKAINAFGYFRILLSYIRTDGNFLEYEPLRRGALWENDLKRDAFFDGNVMELRMHDAKDI